MTPCDKPADYHFRFDFAGLLRPDCTIKKFSPANRTACFSMLPPLHAGKIAIWILFAAPLRGENEKLKKERNLNMRYLMTLGVILLALAVWNSGTTSAQQAPAASYVQDRDHQDQDHHDRDHDRDHRYDRDRVPDGSYRQTCQDIRVDGDRLYAKCQKRNNDWRSTSLKHFDRCRGEIANINGRLECQ
jgi:Ni/Co efflux regulator RcnB